MKNETSPLIDKAISGDKEALESLLIRVEDKKSFLENLLKSRGMEVICHK